MVMASGCVCGPAPEGFDSPLASLDASVDQPVAPDASVLETDAGIDAGVVDAGLPNVPDIEVSATAFIDLGDLAYFPGANPPAAAATRLVVRNVGRAPLFLREPAAGSAGPPSWRITPLTGGRLEQFCAGRFDETSQVCTGELRGYDLNAGLSPGDDVELPLRITPDGLGVHEFLFELFSNDPDELVTSRRLRVTTVFVPPCDVEVSPNGIDFGLLGPGEALEQAITIRNRLTGPNDVCLISNVEVSNAAVFELVDTPRMLRLDPGATKQLKVRAKAPLSVPPTPVAAAAELQFSLANPQIGIQRLPLVVTFGRSCLRLSPSTWNFGTTVVGCATPEKSFDLINQCVTPLTLIRASVSSPPFLANQRFVIRDQLAPGAVLKDALRVRHRPLVAAPLLGAARVEVMQAGVPTTYVAALRGEGIVGGRTSEQFPAASGKTDVLLVIDDSCSMEDKRPLLRGHLPAIVAAAQSKQLDFRIAVAPFDQNALLRTTTTGARWLEPSTPNLGEEYQRLVDVVVPGLPFAGCVTKTLSTLTQNASLASFPNRTFLRDDAALSVICFTDGTEYMPPDRYADEIQSLKGEQRRASVRYSVMGAFSSPTNGCLGGEPNGVHDAFVDPTGGVKEDACTSDWAGAMQRLAQSSFERRFEYDVLGTPDLAMPIRVYVDGAEWPSVTTGTPQITQWSWDVVKNRLMFNPLTQPPVGSTITFEYERACVP